MGRKKQVWKNRWEGSSRCGRIDGKEEVILRAEEEQMGENEG